MLRCRLVWLLLLVGVVLSAQGTRIGGFLVQLDAGWTPVNAEAREGRLGAQFRRAEADGLSTLVFSPHKATFRSEDERRQILHEFEQRMRAEHPHGFATGSYRLGGSEAPYVRYNHGGKSYLLLQPNDANTVYTVLVELPGENREVTPSVPPPSAVFDLAVPHLVRVGAMWWMWCAKRRELAAASAQWHRRSGADLRK